MFWSPDKKLMEDYEIIIPDINHGMNDNSNVNHIETPVKTKNVEISDKHEYSKSDVDNEIYVSTNTINKHDNVFSLIKMDYWRISNRFNPYLRRIYMLFQDHISVWK